MRYSIFLAFAVAVSGCIIPETRVTTTYHPDRPGDRVEVSIELSLVRKEIK